MILTAKVTTGCSVGAIAVIVAGCNMSVGQASEPPRRVGTAAIGPTKIFYPSTLYSPYLTEGAVSQTQKDLEFFADQTWRDIAELEYRSVAEFEGLRPSCAIQTVLPYPFPAVIDGSLGTVDPSIIDVYVDPSLTPPGPDPRSSHPSADQLLAYNGAQRPLVVFWPRVAYRDRNNVQRLINGAATPGPHLQPYPSSADGVIWVGYDYVSQHAVFRWFTIAHEMVHLVGRIMHLQASQVVNPDERADQPDYISTPPHSDLSFMGLHQADQAPARVWNGDLDQPIVSTQDWHRTRLAPIRVPAAGGNRSQCEEMRSPGFYIN